MEILGQLFIVYILFEVFLYLRRLWRTWKFARNPAKNYLQGYQVFGVRWKEAADICESVELDGGNTLIKFAMIWSN